MRVGTARHESVRIGQESHRVDTGSYASTVEELRLGGSAPSSVGQGAAAVTVLAAGDTWYCAAATPGNGAGTLFVTEAGVVTTTPCA